MKKYTSLLGQFLFLLTTHLAYAQMGVGTVEGGGSPKPLWEIILVIVLMFGIFIVGSIILYRASQTLVKSLLQRINSEDVILQERKVKVSCKTQTILTFGIQWFEADIYLTSRALYIIPQRGNPEILSKQIITGVSRLIKQHIIKEVKTSKEELIIITSYTPGKCIWKIKVDRSDLWKEKILENLGSEDETVA